MNTPLASSLADNLYSFYEDFNGFADFTGIKSAGYDYIFSDKYQWPGYIYNIRTRHEACKKLINELATKISEKVLPPFILTNQQEVPEDFEEQMSQAGIKKIDYWPIIYIDLEKILISQRELPDYKIIRIKDEHELRLWFDIVNPILFPHKSIPLEYFLNKLMDKKFTFYLGFYKDMPVNTCMVFTHRNIAGAYMGATIKEFRQKGFGSEIVTAGISDAVNAGCSYITAQSGRLEYHVWEKLGFSVAGILDIYWKLDNY